MCLCLLLVHEDLCVTICNYTACQVGSACTGSLFHPAYFITNCQSLFCHFFLQKDKDKDKEKDKEKDKHEKSPQQSPPQAPQTTAPMPPAGGDATKNPSGVAAPLVTTPQSAPQHPPSVPPAGAVPPGGIPPMPMPVNGPPKHPGVSAVYPQHLVSYSSLSRLLKECKLWLW